MADLIFRDSMLSGRFINNPILLLLLPSPTTVFQFNFQTQAFILVEISHQHRETHRNLQHQLQAALGIYHYKFRGTYEIPTNAEMLQSEDDGMDVPGNQIAVANPPQHSHFAYPLCDHGLKRMQ
nr:hypothetical protein Iba_chr10cCG3020 [Ipomoea batatas]